MRVLIQKKKIGDLVEIFNYIRIPLSSKVRESHQKNFPYYGAQGIVDYVTDYLFDGEYILVAEDGENLRSNNQNICNLVNGKFWVNNHAHILRANSENHNKYLFYNFNRIKFEPYVTGSAQPKLNKENLLNIKTPVHCFKDQKKIAKVLSDLDAKIELNNRINAELEAMAKLVYEYWFVQFDFPFDFKQNKPADETSSPEDIKPYKTSGGKMVWNKEMKRGIPEGWEVKPMNYWIEKDKNGDWGKEEVEGNYDVRVSCIRGADINGLNGNGEIKSPVRYILGKNSHKILEPGDLVIEISGGSPVQSTGRLGYIINETLERFNEPIICSNFCKAITLKDESIQFNFIYEWKRLYDAGIFFGYEGKTSGIKNFLFESFVSKHKIVIPPEELTEKFYEKALPIHSKIQKNLIQNQQSSSLRDWLLPMLMNGQVTVAEAEERVNGELGMVAEPKEVYQTNASKG